MADTEELKQMLLSFRIQELQTLLHFAGQNKLGRKVELQARAMKLLKRPVAAHCMKIRELFNEPMDRAQQNQAGSSSSTINAYPIHPDVQLQSLPFYEVLGELIKPSSLIPTSLLAKQMTCFEFHLTPQQVRHISDSSSDYVIQVQMRFCLLETSVPQEDCFPPDINVRVNRLICALPDLVPPTKAGVQAKRQRCPVSITHLVKLNPTIPNEIYVTWTAESGRGYVIAVYLVQKLAYSDLLQRLRARGMCHSAITIGTINEKLQGDSDCELATTSLRVSLLCPLGKSRMITPCRASTCHHLQCFDASLYLQMNERKSTWICPVCNAPAIYDNLLIDGFFLRVLKSSTLPPDCSDIILYENGLWSPKELLAQSQVLPLPEAPVLDLDNDDLMIVEVKAINAESIKPMTMESVMPMQMESIKSMKDVPVIDLISSDEETDTVKSGSSDPDSFKEARKAVCSTPDSSTHPSHSESIVVLDNSSSLNSPPSSPTSSTSTP